MVLLLQCRPLLTVGQELHAAYALITCMMLLHNLDLPKQSMCLLELSVHPIRSCEGQP